MGEKVKRPCNKWKKGAYERDVDELRDIVRGPRYMCTRCGRCARSKKYLCTPVSVDCGG